jgi:hypothetical protein
MKKILIAVAIMFAGLSAVNAQSGLGIKFGANFPSADVKNLENATPAGFQLGVAYNLDLPLGLSIQPALQYNLKQSALGFETADTGLGILDQIKDNATMERVSVGYLEFMASIQWGIDLIVLRPFLDVSPFVGYALNGDFGAVSDLWKSDGVNKLDYGLALGAGLDLWKFQLVARYSWNFGNLMKTVDALDGNLKDKYGVYKGIKNGNFGGLTVTLGYFF